MVREVAAAARALRMRRSRLREVLAQVAVVVAAVVLIHLPPAVERKHRRAARAAPILNMMAHMEQAAAVEAAV